MWDGVIPSYASETGKFSGVRRLTADTDLDSVYVLFRLESFVGKLVHLSFYRVDRLILGLAMMSIAMLIAHVSKHFFEMSDVAAVSSVLIWLTWPTSHVLVSSTQTFYVVFIAFGMGGAVLFLRARRLHSTIGLALILLSFEMSSMLMFVPVLVLFLEARCQSRPRPKGITRPVLVAGVSVIYFAFSRFVSKPSGFYVGYNTILNPLVTGNWVQIKSSLGEFASFAVLPSIAVAMQLITDFGLDGLQQRKSSLRRRLNEGVAFLIVAAIAPYVLVAKSTPVDDMDWSGRHALLLAISGSIVLGEVLSRGITDFTLNSLGRLARLVPVLTLITMHGYILSNGYIDKVGRQEFERKLSHELRSLNVPPGVVEIVGAPSLTPDFRVYESNYLMYRTYGVAHWWTRIGATADPTFTVPTWIDQEPYQQTYLYVPQNQSCHTTITVSATGFGQVKQVLRSLWGLESSSTVRITDSVIQC